MAHANSASESLFPSTPKEEFPAMVKRLETLKDDNHESFHSQRHVMETICSSDQYARSVFKPNLQQQTKDRYTNIHPSTDYRVKLKVVNNDPCSDYINASWFQSTLPGASTRYIATQAPIPASFADFWRMVWEYDVGVILMLTSFVENDKKKADKYWPDDSKDDLGFGEGETLIRVGLTSTQNVTASIFLRQFAVKRGSESKNVWHIHYTGWPDHGAPRDNQFEEVVQLLKLYREKRATLKGNQPVVFHCSAGVGRNGTFQTIDTILDNLASNNALPINVFNAWLELRVARPGSIQTLDQYKFVFKFIAYCIEKELFGVKVAKKT